jgi:geranylgeranyl diphosphate synthase type I
MSSDDVLLRCDGLEPLGLLVSDELQRRWSRRSSSLDDICAYALMPAGKLLRPILLLDSALAVGGELSPVLPAAVGAECGHVASLIHDDIIDADDLRRGRPSVPQKYGIGDAIVAGDALIFDLFASLAECGRAGIPDSRVVAALDAVARAGLDLCRGQSMEAEMCKRLDFDIDSYMRVARLKTASFFRGACECGSILGGGPPELIGALACYGENLGTAFQIHDDLLCYLSDTRTMGKPTTSDVRNGRLTLPVILAYHSGAPLERQLIKESIASSCDPDLALATLDAVMTRTGAVAQAAQMARRCAEASKRALVKLPGSQSRDRLDCLANLVIDRDR